MATTAAQVLASVQALGYGTDTKTAQLAMLNQVQRRILNARRWTFALGAESLNTVANQEGVAVDASVGATKRIDAVRIESTSGTEQWDLNYIEAPVIRQYLHDNPAAGRPEFWSRRGQSIILYPKPDAIYKLVVDTVNNSAVLSAEGENVLIPDSHIDILVYGIIMQLTFRERDWDGHNFSRQMYAELFTEMIGQYGMQQRQQATHVTDSGQWDNYDPESAIGWPN